MADDNEEFVYLAELDESEVLQSLQNIEKNTAQMVKQLEKMFSQLSTAVSQSARTVSGAYQRAGQSVGESFSQSSDEVIASAEAMLATWRQSQSQIPAEAKEAAERLVLEYKQATTEVKTQFQSLKAGVVAEQKAIAAGFGQSTETIKSEAREIFLVWKRSMEGVGQEAAEATLEFRGRWRTATEAVKQEFNDLKAASAAANRNMGEGGFLASNKFKISMLAAIAAITLGLRQLADRAVQMFADFTKESLQLARSLEAVEASTQGIFTQPDVFTEDQTLAATEEAIAHVRELSQQLGVDLRDSLRVFLPFVENLGQFDRVAGIFTALARSQPEQGELGARIALQEALAGEFRSLRQRFEFTVTQAERLREALKSGGIETFLATFEDELQRMGRSMENFEGTADQTIRQIEQRWLFLREVFAQPILDVVNENLQDIRDTAADSQDDLEILAEVFGSFVAEGFETALVVVKQLFEYILENRDPIVDTIVSLNEAVNSIKLLTDTVSGLQSLGQEDSFIDQVLGDIEGNLRTLQETNENFGKLLDVVSKVVEIVSNFPVVGTFLKPIEEFLNRLDDTTQVENFASDMNFLSKSIVEVQAAFAGAEAGIATFLERMSEGKGIFKAQADALLASSDASQAVWESYAENVEQANQANDEFATGVENIISAHENAAEATTAHADAISEYNFLLRESEAANAALLEAQAAYNEGRIKVDEKILEATIDLGERIEDAEIDRARKLLDLEEELVNKRIEIEEKYLQRIADIRRKHDQDLQDAATDLLRNEQDIARDEARQTLELEEELAKERLRAEEEFRDRLAEIRRKFDFQAEEAIRQNDAVALLRIRRQMEFELNEAQINKDEQIEQAEQTAEERRLELQRGFEQEREDARIANERKLEDLQIALQRQLAEAELHRVREMEALAKFEEDKRKEIEKNYDREIEDLKRQHQRKIAELERSLSAEIELVNQMTAEYEAAVARLNRARAQAVGGPGGRGGIRTPPGRPGLGSNSPINGSQPDDDEDEDEQSGYVPPGPNNPDFRKLGGPALGYTRVGEDGPEGVYFPKPARVIPNTTMRREMMQPRNVINDMMMGGQQSGGGNTLQANVTLDNLLGLNNVQLRQVQNIVTSLLTEAMR